MSLSSGGGGPCAGTCVQANSNNIIHAGKMHVEYMCLVHGMAAVLDDRGVNLSPAARLWVTQKTLGVSVSERPGTYDIGSGK